MYEAARLSRDTLDAIAKYAARATWPTGFSVYQRGAAADGVFVVVRGRAVLRSRVKAGRGFIPTIVMPGGTFGSEGLAVGVPPPPRYVTETRSDAETETLHLSTAQYRAFVREQPSFALALTAQIMAEHAALLEKLRELATLSVEQRLAVALARMAHQRTFVDSTGEVVLDATHYRVLCELVGATRESVSLVLNRLIASGVAERIDGRVLVHPDGIPASPELGWSEPVRTPGVTAAIGA